MRFCYRPTPCPQNSPYPEPYPFRNTLLINDVADLLLLFHVSQNKVQLYNNETEKKMKVKQPHSQ